VTRLLSLHYITRVGRHGPRLLSPSLSTITPSPWRQRTMRSGNADIANKCPRDQSPSVDRRHRDLLAKSGDEGNVGDGGEGGEGAWRSVYYEHSEYITEHNELFTNYCL